MKYPEKNPHPIQCPCGDCENSGCGEYHDTCDKYQTWKQRCDAIKQEQREKRQKEYYGSWVRRY